MTSTWKEWNEDNVSEYYCDNCKEEALTKQKKQGGFEYVLSRFCPFCGAKMNNDLISREALKKEDIKKQSELGEKLINGFLDGWQGIIDNTKQ